MEDHLDIIVSLPMIADGEDKSSPFKNRIRKNYRHIRKWAKRTQTNCFRIYDRDIPQYPFAIDFYAGRFCVHYFARTRDDTEPSREIMMEVENILSCIFNTTADTVYWKTRIRREKTQQYEKADVTKDFFTVIEYGVKFKVNLVDYIDTGLFLDHRETRQLVAKASFEKKVLNLFAYTCSFSVQAAVKGAAFTKSVDMSNTYVAWGNDNFYLNNLSLKNNVVVRADCLKFLDEEKRGHIKYDVIIIDPPTISRSKKMENMFDIQEHYLTLIDKALALLSPHGTIFFSTNSRKFRFDETAFSQCSIYEISYKTLPIDFHDQKIHRAWKIQVSS